MNPMQRALVEKAGHDTGFEYVLPGHAQHVALVSARRLARGRWASAQHLTYLRVHRQRFERSACVRSGLLLSSQETECRDCPLL